MSESRIGEVLEFWFGAGGPEAMASEDSARRWFQKDELFDATIRSRFGALYEAAREGTLDAWAQSPRGRLALVLILDQFPRNLFRGSERMFESDPRALALADEGLARGEDRGFGVDGRSFLYLPLMHSEALEVQERCVSLYEQLAGELEGEAKTRALFSLDFARRHRDIVKRFGRFPHRNALLGRDSTEEELAFLQEPGSSF